jgi:hypothetical protein
MTTTQEAKSSFAFFETFEKNGIFFFCWNLSLLHFKAKNY